MTEVTGGGYARVGVASSLANWAGIPIIGESMNAWIRHVLPTEFVRIAGTNLKVYKAGSGERVERHLLPFLMGGAKRVFSSKAYRTARYVRQSRRYYARHDPTEVHPRRARRKLERAEMMTRRLRGEVGVGRRVGRLVLELAASSVSIVRNPGETDQQLRYRIREILNRGGVCQTPVGFIAPPTANAGGSNDGTPVARQVPGGGAGASAP